MSRAFSRPRLSNAGGCRRYPASAPARAFSGQKAAGAGACHLAISTRVRRLGSGIETLVRAESGTTLNDMSHVRSLAAVAIVVLVAGCGQYDAYTDPAARATALPGRYAPYVGPGDGWGGPTVSLYTPSWGGRGG